MNAKEIKQGLRQTLIRFRREIPRHKKDEVTKVISESVIMRPEYTRALHVCMYMSLPEEVDTWSLIKNCLALRSSVVVLRVERERLCAHRIVSIDDLVVGQFGISEPKTTCPEVPIASIDLFIVPGIAFDRQGYRLGWGKGYYDKLLATVTASKIGLAFDCQIVPRLPHEKYDIPMDVIITEKETIVPQKEV